LRVLISAITALFIAASVLASPSFTAKRESLDVTDDKVNSIKLHWKGEVANESLVDANLAVVLSLINKRGKVVTQLEGRPFLAKRLTTYKVEDDFKVKRELWVKAESVKTGVKFLGSPNNNDKVSGVEIFVTNSCPYCKRALAHLNRLGVEYTKLNVQTDRKAYNRMKTINPRGGVPTLLIDGKDVHIGYSPELYDSLFKK